MSVTYSSPWCDVFDIIVSGKGFRWSTPTRWSLYNIMWKKIVDNRLLSVMLCRRYYLIWYRLSVTDSCHVKTIQSNVNKMSITDSKSGWDVIGTILCDNICRGPTPPRYERWCRSRCNLILLRLLMIDSTPEWDVASFCSLETKSTVYI